MNPVARLSHYNCRPLPGKSWGVAKPEPKKARWIVQRTATNKRSLLKEDAEAIQALLKRDSSETLHDIADELKASPEFLKAMLAAHGCMLDFYYREKKRFLRNDDGKRG